MIVKERHEPEALRIIKALQTRSVLADKEEQAFFQVSKGFNGERRLDEWLDLLEIESLVLNDLLLEVSGTLFQLDSLVITQETVLLFEVKNYEGDYYYQGEILNTLAGTEIKDPFLQLKRSESLLRQLLKSLGFNLPVAAHLIFVNPSFTLYQAPRNHSIIFHGQMDRFIKKLNKIHSKLTSKHRILAEKLIELNISESPFLRIPEYDYGLLRKGIVCRSCERIIESHNKKNFFCPNCGSQETIESAVIRSTEEFKLLFPELQVTTNKIFDWCGESLSKKAIRRGLKKNYRAHGYGQWSYYE